jgi:hypothetical protein
LEGDEIDWLANVCNGVVLDAVVHPPINSDNMWEIESYFWQEIIIFEEKGKRKETFLLLILWMVKNKVKILSFQKPVRASRPLNSEKLSS